MGFILLVVTVKDSRRFYGMLTLTQIIHLQFYSEPKTPSKYEALQLLLLHHNGNYDSVAKVHILLGFRLS
jgi:hypothetical protein